MKAPPKKAPPAPTAQEVALMRRGAEVEGNGDPVPDPGQDGKHRVQLRVSPRLIQRLDAYRASQSRAPTRTDIFLLALEQFLDREER